MHSLYREHAQRAVKLAYFMVGDHDLAEDLVQDAFIRVFGRWAELKEPQAFSAYLDKTVVNLSRKYFRRRHVERRYLERERALSSQRVSQNPDVETRDELWTALNLLPRRQQIALVLRFYADMSEAEIAETMSTSLSAAHSLVTRGLQTLRGRTEGEGVR
jgi:RNA polymerase sigma factor (sigma-70 family)